MIANSVDEKKLDVPVQAAIARSHGCLTTQSSPSFTCGHIFGRGFEASYVGGSSRCRIEIMNRLETTKLTASATIAYGAVIAAIRTPERFGPPTCAIATASCSFEFPSTNCSRGTSAGRYDWYATSKNTVKTPITNCSTSKC